MGGRVDGRRRRRRGWRVRAEARAWAATAETSGAGRHEGGLSGCSVVLSRAPRDRRCRRCRRCRQAVQAMRVQAVWDVWDVWDGCLSTRVDSLDAGRPPWPPRPPRPPPCAAQTRRMGSPSRRRRPPRPLGTLTTALCNIAMSRRKQTLSRSLSSPTSRRLVTARPAPRHHLPRSPAAGPWCFPAIVIGTYVSASLNAPLHHP
jgi:hypothetical protein